MKRFIKWIFDNFSADENPRRPPGVPKMSKPPVRKPALKAEVERYSAHVEGKIVDAGPGKNQLIRNKYIREDTGTHETLRIVDDSMLESDDEFGIDPYNTGRFDRSRSWDSSRSRK